ncbi:type II toxin-antitoxin system VapC family toxin [Sphingobacterium sp. SGG-5]|uniref:type II toxin-antitoxin system VapC family toxin n=1 Tax=Sphingobacterium sp. SGG-5 TaxID=2710881 RepID=UPI0013EE1174|nr:PIN domain-containing protein [Sphingobacterium sp. SGG-5]NGM61945.1 type II toxin-antitoxin system VapC family toxin [Sphingobacterium sp. SGG-5]
MGRFLLDTNILIFLLLGENDQLSNDVDFIIETAQGNLNTSSISVTELVQLYKIKKIKSKKYKAAFELVQAIERDLYIKILPFAKEHTEMLSRLEIAEGHHDPFDHSIISHAITEKLTLVSSDRKFEKYTKQKLNFVFNKR